jgi:hypothetical protein
LLTALVWVQGMENIACRKTQTHVRKYFVNDQVGKFSLMR